MIDAASTVLREKWANEAEREIATRNASSFVGREVRVAIEIDFCQTGFVQAARLCGNGEFRILLTQILPNIMPIMIVQMSLTMGYAILNAAGLSFIGLGVRPPTAEWGIMVAEGASFMVSGEWWIALFPGLALMIAVFCFNLLGDGLRDIVDPQRRT